MLASSSVTTPNAAGSIRCRRRSRVIADIDAFTRFGLLADHAGVVTELAGLALNLFRYSKRGEDQRESVASEARKLLPVISSNPKR